MGYRKVGKHVFKAEMSPMEDLRSHSDKYVRKAIKALEVASDVADMVVQLRDRPRMPDYLSVALKLTNSYVRHNAGKIHDCFDGWEVLDLWGYNDHLYEIATALCEGTLLAHKEENKAYSFDIHGQEIGWVIYGKDDIRGPWVREGKRTESMRAMGRMIWEYVGSSSCELGKKKQGHGGYSSSRAVFRPDTNTDIYESELANKILARAKRFISKGYSRSVILFGIAGSGKSSAMRYVAKEFGKYSLRINVSDLNNFDSEDMLVAIEMLQPDILMIDDFDRCYKPDSLLTELEQFNKSVNLFMVSINRIEGLSDAIIRPGRFDDIIEFNTIDKSIRDKLIGEVPEDVYKKLSRLPVAYIVEFKKRREVLGAKEAIEEVEQLQERIRMLSPDDDDDDDEDEAVFPVSEADIEKAKAIIGQEIKKLNSKNKAKIGKKKKKKAVFVEDPPVKKARPI